MMLHARKCTTVILEQCKKNYKISFSLSLIYIHIISCQKVINIIYYDVLWVFKIRSLQDVTIKLLMFSSADALFKTLTDMGELFSNYNRWTYHESIEWDKFTSCSGTVPIQFLHSFQNKNNIFIWCSVLICCLFWYEYKLKLESFIIGNPGEIDQCYPNMK
jgi:hypothetical protein